MRSRRFTEAMLTLLCMIALSPAVTAQDLYVRPSNAYAQSLADKLLNNQQAKRPVVQRLGSLVGPQLQKSKKITSVIISTKCDHYTNMDVSFDDGTTQSALYNEKVQPGDADALRDVSTLIHIISESCESS